MYRILKTIKVNNEIWVALLVTLFAGILGGFAFASLVCTFFVFAKETIYKDEIILILFLSAFILGDNFNGRLAFAQNLRFSTLGITLLYLQTKNLFQNNLGNKLLIFSVIALLISFAYSPLGTPALLRALSYWLMAISIFKLVQLIYKKNKNNLSHIIIFFIISYLLINIIAFKVPIGINVYLEGRFCGLMANPNGLGLLMLMFYPLIDLFIKRGEIQITKKHHRYIKIMIAFVSILTRSRNSLFSIVIYELAILLSKNKIIFTCSLLTIIILYYSINTSDIVTVIQQLGLGEYLRIETLQNASGRTEVWKVAWQEAKKSLLLGNGMMYDNYYIFDYGNKYLGPNRPRFWWGIWNSYLSLLLNVGIVGMLAYAYFFNEMYKRAHLKDLAFAFLIMVLFSAITESWLAASMNAFTPLFFLYWAVQAQTIKIGQ